LAGLLTAAFLVTNIPVAGGGLSERLPELMQSPERSVIWKSSWEMLQASPWKGIGLGLYYQVYPAFRSPADVADGFFAHNDYLQIWIESGLPGLALLLAVLVAALWLFVRALRKTNLRDDARVEMTGLFCGLLAMAGHSLVDFNFYILSIMMASGLALGRFHELAAGNLKAPVLRLRPSRFIGKPVYPLIVVLLALLPIFYFLALGISNSYFELGKEQAIDGKLEKASQSFTTARRLTPSDDRILLAHADLYRRAISVLPPEEFDGMKAMYEDALWLLDQAQQVNALRALTFVYRARLYQQNPAFAGANAYDLAAESFRRGLAMNPLMFQGRMDYVSLLLQAGKKEEALQSMEEGVRYNYPSIPELAPFFALTAKLRREAGREEEARYLENKARGLEKLNTAGNRSRS
jgi:tetratricopeptide (TPR) repeat protein